MSCDEKVLSGEEHSSKAYSMTLLSFAANRRFPLPSPLSFGETEVKGRIKNVLGWKKPSVRISIAAAVVCVVTIIGCAGNPKNEMDAIYDKLEDMVKCKVSEDFPNVAEIWIGTTDNEEGGYLVGTMILRDAKIKGLDYLSDVTMLEVDGTKWLSVVCRAIVEGEHGDDLYEMDNFELMIPVTIEENGDVELGNIKGQWHCFHEPIGEVADTSDFLEKVFYSMDADVTHDGIADHIVVFGAKLEEENREIEETAEEFFLQTANLGYVRVFAEFSTHFYLSEENGYEITEEQREQIFAFRDDIKPLYEGADLVIALDISDKKRGVCQHAGQSL